MLLVKNIAKIVGVDESGRLRVKGRDMNVLGEIDNAWLLADGDRIAAYGTMDKMPEITPDTEVVDAEGGMLFPSFCDSHTHLVYAGSREQEFLDKINGLSYEESNRMMAEDPEEFKKRVQESLRRQVAAINKLTAKGMYFFDYGNAFLLESSRAGADIMGEGGRFRYPSYVQDIMGPMFFDYGFGPFRWVCTSGKPEDLATTDRLATEVLEEIRKTAPKEIAGQLDDNIHWIKEAGKNKLVVGSQARILYADSEGRTKIALAFNDAIARGEISAPVVLGRDHHDVSGTDSPYRETSNIYDGSNRTADMAVQNVIGDSFRGATWVSIHNGGGVGWGEVINGGFGMVIDGSEDSARHIKEMLLWDVNNGIARRSWARNEGAMFAIKREMERTPGLKVTLPNLADDKLVRKAIDEVK
jgi:urocanate hydratase